MPTGPREGRRILGVGVATLDLINEVETYPAEDAEARALAQRRVPGGNAANSLSVLAQLGHCCTWMGSLAQDEAAGFVRSELERRGVEVSYAPSLPGAATPTSYICLSRATGSRSIVHYRDLPELDAAGFGSLPLSGFDWVHFEGRTPGQTAEMMRRVRSALPNAWLSVELEKPRPGMEQLLGEPRVLLAGRAYAAAMGFDDAGRFLAHLVEGSRADLCVVAWGEAGAGYLVRGARPQWVPARAPERVLDTLGAGDCLNAALIDGLARGLPPGDSVARAVALAGFKCGHPGLEGVVEAARMAGWI